jgi:uncharacterized membrane protein (UPF0182 family)
VDKGGNKLKKGKIGIRALLIAILLLVAVFISLIGYITDFLWFKELGYTTVFFTKIFTQLKIGIPAFLIITLITYIYLKLLKRGYFKKVESQDVPNEKLLNKMTWGLAAIFSAIFSTIIVSQLWFEILKFINSTPFGIKDPMYSLDISFYVFKLDFITQLNQLMIGVLIGFGAITVIYYLMLMSVRKPEIFEKAEEPQEDTRYDGTSNSKQSGFGGFGSFANMGGLGDILGKAFGVSGNMNTPYKMKKQFDDENFMRLMGIAAKQLIAIGVLFFVMLGTNFYLKQYSLLYSKTDLLYGAGYTDANVTLWVYRILILLSLVAAVTFAFGIIMKKYRVMLTVPVIMIVVGLIGSGAAMVVQNFIVSPDEINKESQYLERNIQFTQKAYGLNEVTIKPFAASNQLTKDDILNNMDTISNIRINDFEPAVKFYNQTQTIRLYYTFNDVDVDRYIINGKYTQTFLSAREIDETKIRQEWLNVHLKYTHGYGITLSRVDTITASGQPDMLIKGIPPISAVDEITITRPEVYFGELTNNYILTNTDEQEFDYPEGDNNTYTTYEGDAGIKLGLVNRALFAIREKSLKLLVSTNINNDSKIVINRNIAERVRKIMPYLHYDGDPYIVTNEGKLYWMVDAYTVSNRYPYSQPYSVDTNINYIKNSIKVVVDAYDGSVNYYIVDENDPIASTYKRIYPDLFKDFNEMPEGLQAHIRYPNALFDIQANVYKKYHMSNVKVFYQGEDLWDISNQIYGTAETTMTPNYFIMKLPGEEKTEFVNSIPFTPKAKKNMSAYLVARNDGDNYGKLVLYQLPKDKLIYGPMQIEAQIDQNTEISKEFSLWNSSGSTYTRGDMFVIPIEDSFIYVEPVYLEATNSSIPEVKRVIVAYGDRIAYQETLAKALDSLFGSGDQNTGTGSVEEPGNTDGFNADQIIVLAAEAFNNAQTAQKNGDWAAYGEYMKQVQTYLNQLVTPQN